MKKKPSGGQASVEYAISAAILGGLSILGGKLLILLIEGLRTGALFAAIAPGRDF